MTELILNGISSMNYNLVLRERPAIPSPELDVEQIEIRGRSGSLTRKYKYKNLDMTVRLNLYSKDIKPDLRQIKAWLMKATKLEFSDEVGYYTVDKVSIGNIENTFRRIGVFEVVFNCKPFLFKDVVKPAITGSGAIIKNEGTEIAQPTIKVTGSGNINFSINGRGFQIIGLTDYITIDSEMGLSHRNLVGKDSMTNGEMPYLDVGNNTFAWIGTVTKIEVSYKECYI